MTWSDHVHVPNLLPDPNTLTTTLCGPWLSFPICQQVQGWRLDIRKVNAAPGCLPQNVFHQGFA